MYGKRGSVMTAAKQTASPCISVSFRIGSVPVPAGRRKPQHGHATAHLWHVCGGVWVGGWGWGV
jgi:hypothetical protein